MKNNIKIKFIQIKQLYSKGFFHIIGSSILNKIMQFCSGIFIVRVLSKEEFGISINKWIGNKQWFSSIW